MNPFHAGPGPRPEPRTLAEGLSRLNGRLAGLAVAAVALALRAPFIVVLVLAGAAGALVHVLWG